MWISDCEGDLVNLRHCLGIIIRPSEGKHSIIGILPNGKDACIAIYNTNDQAKNRLAQIRQALRNAGHFINLD